jgi:hypothetical protein
MVPVNTLSKIQSIESVEEEMEDSDRIEYELEKDSDRIEYELEKDSHEANVAYQNLWY